MKPQLLCQYGQKAMSYERMQQSEAELKSQIDALLQRAKHSDEAEADEPELDIPAEIERREKRLEAIVAARQRLEQHQREADTERGRRDDDNRRPSRRQREVWPNDTKAHLSALTICRT